MEVYTYHLNIKGTTVGNKHYKVNFHSSAVVYAMYALNHVTLPSEYHPQLCLFAEVVIDYQLSII